MRLLKDLSLVLLPLVLAACDSTGGVSLSPSGGSTTAQYNPTASNQGAGVSPQSGVRPDCSNAAQNTGNGWGWENNRSCRFVQPVSGPQSEQQVQPNVDTSTVPGSQSLAQCTPSAIDSGGGFGWENSRSCRWPADSNTNQANANQSSSEQVNNQSPSNSGPVNVPGPVSVQVKGYENGRPICLTDASDGNGDRYGFESDRTCVVKNGTTATAQNPLTNTRWCQPWAEISYGDYVLQNNTWNSGEVYSNDWHQCIELGRSGSGYVAKWDYNWLGRSRGEEYAVKSYPQVYYGRKTSNSISGSVNRLGLPVKVTQLPNYKVKFKYSETGDAERNVALESFFHSDCNAEQWNKRFEMMVWVGVPEIRDPGPKVADVTIDGIKWGVYTNPKLSWGYVAFVAEQTITEGYLDWKKFVDWTRFNGPSYGVARINDNECMGAIEIGTETFWGQGTFRLDEFRVTR